MTWPNVINNLINDIFSWPVFILILLWVFIYFIRSVMIYSLQSKKPQNIAEMLGGGMTRPR